MLAFRKYTQAVTTYELFVEQDEQSRIKFNSNPEQRLEYLSQYEHIGFQALDQFLECLETWPNQLIGKEENQNEHQPFPDGAPLLGQETP